jgi:aspartate/glutamate racemase
MKTSGVIGGIGPESTIEYYPPDCSLSRTEARRELSGNRRQQHLSSAERDESATGGFLLPWQRASAVTGNSGSVIN